MVFSYESIKFLQIQTLQRRLTGILEISLDIHAVSWVVCCVILSHKFSCLQIILVMKAREQERNKDRIDQHLVNEIPIRLIRLSDMKFAGRGDVLKHFRDSNPQYGPRHPFRYAILSHRWLAEGEPTYEEIKSGTAKGPGYQKLKKFCEKARTYNVEFAWSDTCCIDKSSSSELDESIRSMFTWYRNSYICIIHLAQSETIEDIMDDEWTERGWTLQELLAPRDIKLFNKHWMPMTHTENDKSRTETEVMKTLVKATGIPLNSICFFDSRVGRVDERMLWAARRNTTRPEDVAYSLLGIFDVSLQIAYGEGGERAFCRLIEAIMRGGDISVLNWVGECAYHESSYAIPQSPQNFVGRTLELPLGSDGQLEMTMTSLGLRVPLVVLPLRITSGNGTSDGVAWVEWDFTLECTLCPAIRCKTTLSIHVYEEIPRQFALGIVNYSLVACEAPRVLGKSVGCIIWRRPSDPTICTPSSADFIGLKTASPPEHEFGRWWKAEGTGLVEVNFPNIPSNSQFYLSREYLEIVYL